MYLSFLLFVVCYLYGVGNVAEGFFLVVFRAEHFLVLAGCSMDGAYAELLIGDLVGIVFYSERDVCLFLGRELILTGYGGVTQDGEDGFPYLGETELCGYEFDVAAADGVFLICLFMYL